MRRLFALLVLFIVLSGSSVFASGFVPLGAYMAWERCINNAKYFNIDLWTDVTQRLDILKANNINSVWVVNITQNYHVRLVKECEKRGIAVFLAMGEVDVRGGNWGADGSYYDKLIPALVKSISDSNALVTWVLGDEPGKDKLPIVEQVRQKFAKYDPSRKCIVVTMWPDAPEVVKLTGLPYVCVDLYPFFGPGDINGPHTDEASKAFYRMNLRNVTNSIQGSSVHLISMGMAFTEVWGPYKFDKNWNTICLPGSYMHWRSPTEAEMRWQAWEALRLGCKGIFIFLATPMVPDPCSATLPAANVTWKEILAKEPTNIGPSALINPDRTETPQLISLGKAYGSIKGIIDIIGRWEKIENPVCADTNESIQCFKDPMSGDKYCVVVNDDFSKDRVITLRFNPDVKNIRNVIENKTLTCSQDFAGGAEVVSVRLSPGDGTVVGFE